MLTPLKKGMTNNSFVFSIQDKRYIIRVPGVYTESIINRQQEMAVYSAINNETFLEPVVYMDSKTGYKISRFIECSHTVDSRNWYEVSLALQKLKRFHNKNLKVSHSFDIFNMIEYYESLYSQESVYKDYKYVKRNILSLQPVIEQLVTDWTLCHIDSVCDNFLITKNNQVYLIDFEYAGMQDPDLDIAMFIVYSLYGRTDIDRIINMYFDNQVSRLKRYKIYAYIAIAGLLWSNWCEAKQDESLLNSEYAKKQYRYAKEYYQIIVDEACDMVEFNNLVKEYD